MSEILSKFLRGTLYLAIGTLVLRNLDAIVGFDQHSGVRLKSWFNRKLGKSVLNRELWSVGTPSGFRTSRIVLQIAGVIALLMGLLLVGLSFVGRFN